MELRAYANSIVKNCSSYDEECRINAIYQHVIENYNYLSDPSYREYIQSPQDTMQIKGGDCEDLAIFLNSLLECIGIDTCLVLTNDHAYSLAKDVDTLILWPYVKNSIMTSLEKSPNLILGDYFDVTQDETITIEGDSCMFFGHNGTQSYEFEYGSEIANIDIIYDIESTGPIDFYIVTSEDDFEAFKNNEVYYHYPTEMKENVNKLSGTFYYGNMSTGIILSNVNEQSATVNVDIKRHYYVTAETIFNNATVLNNFFKNITLTSYNIDSMNCLVLEPTTGISGYAGYEWATPGEKIAFDSITHEYYYIEYSENSKDILQFKNPIVEVGDIWNYSVGYGELHGTRTTEIMEKTSINVEGETYYVFIEKSTISLNGINNASLKINQTSYYRETDNAIVKRIINSTYSDDTSNTSSSQEFIYHQPYDIMQYPIESGEDWQNYYILETFDLINITNTSIDSQSEYFECMRTETVDVSNQDICCFVLKKSNSEEETGGYSLLWVSPSVGFGTVGMDTYENNQHTSFMKLTSYTVANSGDPKSTKIVEYPTLS
ncbi:MAG: transglutaminase-like domain-containing protein [Euryarchaeota archaeon]|nr:transglutaminase-like domain-containing protein [Euryarchaeota archaeon]